MHFGAPLQSSEGKPPESWTISVPKLQSCLGVEWKIRAPKRQCEWKIRSKIVNIKFINVKNGDFSGIALTSVFWQSPISKHQLRAGNSPLRAEVRVENYPPLGVISHPKRQILGHCEPYRLGSNWVHFSATSRWADHPSGSADGASVRHPPTLSSIESGPNAASIVADLFHRPPDNRMEMSNRLLSHSGRRFQRKLLPAARRPPDRHLGRTNLTGFVRCRV